MEYSSINLINDLKYALEKITPDILIINNRKIKMFQIKDGEKIIPYQKLSILLGQYSRYLKYKMRAMKLNRSHKIALDNLNYWEQFLRNLLGPISQSAIDLLNKYRTVNKDLPQSSEYKVQKYHSKLNTKYFEKIDTKEKAYWLGFLFAELYIGANSAISLELDAKDEILIDRFIQALVLNPDYKKEYFRKDKNTDVVRHTFRIRFKSQEMERDLLSHGYVASKLRQTSFPSLDNRELDLAFL